jgi:site-specific DNA-methyltransferase (adenine-specific)
MLARFDVAQRGDALDMLRSLPDSSGAVMVFDPQHRGVLDRLKFGNEGVRQIGRAALPPMSDEYIDACLREAARVLRPSAYVFLWVDTFNLCMAAHRRVSDVLPPVDLIAWDCLRMGMGKRSRRRGDYVLMLQKPPIAAKSWTDHAIPSRWQERVDRDRHPHCKPTELTARLITAITKPGDLVIDPAAGSFLTLEIAQLTGRKFIGVDITWGQNERNTSS